MVPRDGEALCCSIGPQLRYAVDQRSNGRTGRMKSFPPKSVLPHIVSGTRLEKQSDSVNNPRQ